jgi:hypothetical protein
VYSRAGTKTPEAPRTRLENEEHERNSSLKKSLILSAFAVALAAPAGAQPATGMGAMQYYVGSWSCVAGSPMGPPSTATTNFVAGNGILRQWVSVPMQGKMKGPYAISIAITYDGKKGRFVETTLDSNGAWSIDEAKPWSGNTEFWTDSSTSDGKLGRSQIVRTDKNNFVLTAYATPTSAKPNFKVTCKRSS